MPEGPEVRISAELIRPLVINKSIVSAFQSNNGRYASSEIEGHGEFLNDLKGNGCHVMDIKTKGKFMYWLFSNNQILFNTFGMSGQWSQNPGKHPCFVFYFNDDSQIHFNDPRHFGTIKFTNNLSELHEKLNELGWDGFTPLTEDYKKIIIKKLSKSKKNIGHMLLDQTTFCGVGNYIRCEVLYAAKMSPKRLCSTLSENDILNLCDCIKNVLEESYLHQGATLHTYKDSYGNEGKYSGKFKVYGRKTDDLGNLIVRETSTEGRTIHWCPAVQI